MRLFQICLALAVLSAAISMIGQWLGRTIAMGGHTDRTTIHEVVIGNSVIAVPANMIRFESARRSGVAARLDLYLRWPGLDGYSEPARDDFDHIDGSRNIIFLSLQEPLMSRDMSGRYEPIYRRLIEQRAMAGPEGLAMHGFLPNSGYLDEVLAVGWRNGRNEPFVARCLDGDQARTSLAPCERDVHLGDGLSLTYRFPAHLLADWTSLDARLLGALDPMLKTGR